MGDFFLTGLEAEIAPIVLHFVNQPKPWHYGAWRGEPRFARAYADWFAASPWPHWGLSPDAPALRGRKPSRSALRDRFAASLSAFLGGARFLDA